MPGCTLGPQLGLEAELELFRGNMMTIGSLLEVCRLVILVSNTKLEGWGLGEVPDKRGGLADVWRLSFANGSPLFEYIAGPKSVNNPTTTDGNSLSYPLLQNLQQSPWWSLRNHLLDPS